jgi:serine/threonine protein kinase
VKICPACSKDFADEVPRCDTCGVGLLALTVGEATKAEALIGQVVSERYKVERILGRGGMGTVYACRHVVVGKDLALKVLRPGNEPTEAVLDRFVREAQAAARIKSRHICEVLDFGQLPDGSLYAVMELLVGEDLSRALRKGRLRTRELLHVFAQAADTLALAHDAGIVHRDLKPDNLFLLDDEGDPLFLKILDFGIAKFADKGPAQLTETGVILGTPFYMSPEQARGEPLDHRTDVYSLGVVMYRAFTGRLPFVADSTIGVLARHVTDPPEPPSHITSIDPGLERVILRCLEKKREARFASMRELAGALRAVRAELDALPSASAPHAAFTPPPQSLSPSGRSAPFVSEASGPFSGPSGSHPPIPVPPYDPATSRVLFAATTGPTAPTPPAPRGGAPLAAMGAVVMLAFGAIAAAVMVVSQRPAEPAAVAPASPPALAAPAEPAAPEAAVAAPEPGTEAAPIALPSARASEPAAPAASSPSKATAAAPAPSASASASAPEPAEPPPAAPAASGPKKKRPAEIRSPFD